MGGHAGQRRLLLVLAALTMSACGGGGDSGDNAAEPLPTARYAIPSETSAPSPAPSASVTAAAIGAQVVTSEDTPAARTTFAKGMTEYCTRFYTLQSKAEDAHPRPDLPSQVQFARATAKAAETTELTLGRLRPPPDLVDAFSEFVAVTGRITSARQDIAESLAIAGEEGPGGDAFEEAVSARRPLASELGAPGCDGRLPTDQERAAVAALRDFETTSDSTRACRDLATPGFLQTRWFDLPKPLEGCIATRDQQRDGGVGLATDIKVRKVTGSDGVAATVTYTLVGGCECGDLAVARLHLVEGRWRVSELGS